MYQNKVTLIGFLGNNADVRYTNTGSNVTTLSLATKSSHKQNGQYVSHTDWHRCVAFGKLAEYAATLKKGTHLLVEGELRSSKYESQKTGTEVTAWEIRVDSIIKLDRVEKASEGDHDNSDEGAAA